MVTKNKLDKDVKLTFALVGNQNCGKTTLFNQITGMNQHVGNFPGCILNSIGSPIGANFSKVNSVPGIIPISKKCCLIAPDA